MEKYVYSMLIYDLDENYSLNYPLSIVVKEITTVTDQHRVESIFILSNYELGLYSSFTNFNEAFNDFIGNLIIHYKMYVENEVEFNFPYLYPQKYKRILTKLITKE